MKRSFLYLAIAILAFGVGTYFGLYSYSQKIENQPVLQNETVLIPSKLTLQSETLPTQTNNLINFDDLKINGIGLDSTEKDLVKRFGKPLKSGNNGYNACAELNEKTLLYPGLELHLLGSKNRKYEVYDMEISSPKWVTASGIKVGDDIEEVIAKFGKGHNEVENSGLVNLYYYDSGGVIGGARLSFRDNKLVIIWLGYTLC